MIGSLTCTICGSTYSCTINQLSREVDIYSEWVDTFEYASNSEVVKPTPSFRTIHRHHSERSLSETLEGFQNLEIDNERAQAQVHTRASTQSKNQPTTTDTIIIEKQLLRAKDRQRKYFKKLDETHVQVKGQGDQTFDDLSWDYSTLDGADLDDVDLDNSDLDEDHYESGDSHS
ncbi:hypothetical protein BGZ46_010235 [Entomortierella lignicola]|nr:hypothetical protein BGZ46_010235 [Entomortierella lignicola]